MDSDSRSPAGRTATRINGWTCTRRCRMGRLTRCCRPIASHRHAWTNPTRPIRRMAARSLLYGRRTFEMGRPLGWSSSSLISQRVRQRRSRGTGFPYDTYDIGHPRWSPDGSRIAFHVVEGPPTERRLLIFPEPTSPGPSSIYVVGTDGSGLRQVTPVGVPAGDPDWSPDGSFIVFGPTSLHLWLYGQNQATWIIRAIRADGSDLHVVVPGDSAATPSWTARGDQILFTQQDGNRQVIRFGKTKTAPIFATSRVSHPPARSRCTRSSSPCPERTASHPDAAVRHSHRARPSFGAPMNGGQDVRSPTDLADC